MLFRSTWREVIATNLDSLFYVSKAAVRRMIPRGKGSIINICSVMSELGRPTVVPYTAAKGGVKMLTKGMAVDWGRHGIRVNGIGPGYFKTPLNAALVADEKFSAWIAGRADVRRDEEDARDRRKGQRSLEDLLGQGNMIGVSPAFRQPCINFGTERSWWFTRKLGKDTFTPSGANVSCMRATSCSKYG